MKNIWEHKVGNKMLHGRLEFNPLRVKMLHGTLGFNPQRVDVTWVAGV